MCRGAAVKKVNAALPYVKTLPAPNHSTRNLREGIVLSSCQVSKYYILKDSDQWKIVEEGSVKSKVCLFNNLSFRKNGSFMLCTVSI